MMVLILYVNHLIDVDDQNIIQIGPIRSSLQM